MPFTELQSYLDETEPSGNHYYWKTEYLHTLDEALLATARELYAECPIPEADIGVLQLGPGALAEHAGDDGAVGNRDARYVIGVKGMWEPAEPNAEAYQQWVRDAWARVHPFSSGGNYVNFQTADEGEERLRATYGVHFDRLREVKRMYDPENLFRSNRNIRP
jgi:hypothetical protein